MANNRMWLVCRSCNERFLLGKCMGDGCYYTRPFHSEELEEFYDEHYCCDLVNPQNVFKLCYESAYDVGVEEI